MAETMRSEWVVCGKESCTKCPHGPYWYAYWREGKKVKKRYVGKGHPDEHKQQKEPPREKAGRGEWEETEKGFKRKEHKHDRIFSEQTASIGLAWEILGLPSNTEYAEMKKAYRKLAMMSHPDRGGDELIYKRYNAAYTYLCKTRFAGCK